MFHGARSLSMSYLRFTTLQPQTLNNGIASACTLHFIRAEKFCFQEPLHNTKHVSKWVDVPVSTTLLPKGGRNCLIQHMQIQERPSVTFAGRLILNGGKKMNKKTTSLRFLFLPVLLIAGLFVSIFLLSSSVISTKIVNAFSNPSIPDYCIPIELKMIEENLSLDPNAKSYMLWIEKRVALEKSMEECALQAISNPPASKPEMGIGELPPTTEPVPQIEVGLGIQKTVLLPSNDFIPTLDSEFNYWAGLVNGKTIQILAGIQPDRDEKWRETHPEWVGMGPQGAVKILNSDWSFIKIVGTPTRNGYVHFVGECESQLILQAEDGTSFVFDPVSLVFVSNDSTCTVNSP